MAAEVLNEIIFNKISAEKVIEWITTNKPINCPILMRCNKEDFVPYFLNFLREETSRILRVRSPLPRKALFPSPQTTNSDIVTGLKSLDLDSSVKSDTPDENAYKRGGVLSPPGKPLAHSSPVHSSDSLHRRNNFNLQDFIVKGGKSVRKKSPSRKRITPTRLGNKARGFGSASQCELSSVFSEQPLEMNKSKDFEEERTLLRKERARQQFDCKQITVSPAKIISCVEPQPSLVSSPSQLAVLAALYSLILDCNLAMNLMTELCFVMGLLIIHTPVPKVESQYFSSVHDCVYFSTSVLNRQRKLLELFDKVTLKMLADNKRIYTFTPELSSFINTLLTADVLNARKKTFTYLSSRTLMNVSFLSDTDNRQNFPSDQAFHVFRKQRDGLYDILRIWEANHLTPGWSFTVALGEKIRALLRLHQEAANFVHFARLFRSQLLGSSKCNDSSVSNDSEIDMLKEVHPDKLSRLRERLVTPIQSTSCKPIFPGHQEFYRDFIVHSQNPTFLQHLSDSLAAEICILDATGFSASDLEDKDTSVDDVTRSSYVACVTTLQLMAKFLGFITFLPYQSKVKSLPENTIDVQCNIRSKLQPQLDVLAYVKNAVQQHKLILTIPWVVEYLCFMDPVSVHLPYYRNLFSVIFQIYRDSRPLCHAVLLIRLLLGRLFESQNFPEGLFYSCTTTQHDENYNDTDEHSHGDLPLDYLDVVDEHCLYTCCPNIGDLKLSLSAGLGPSGKVAKHITPVSASLNQSSQSSAARQLELQLEESFFHAHAASMRKTVEFVAERVASCCVKHICNVPLPTVKQEGSAELSKLTSKITPEEDEDEMEIERQKELLMHEAFKIATRCSSSLKQRCNVNDYCEKRTRQSIPLLLPDDVLPAVSDACMQIATRQCRERVNTWIHSHITPGLFMKDFQLEIDRAFKKTNNNKGEKVSHVVPPGGRNIKHVDEALTPARAMMQLRLLIWKVLDGEHKAVNEEEVSLALKTAKETPETRTDLIISAERLLATLSSDLAMLLVTHRPDLMQTGLLDQFASIWENMEKCTSFTNLLCPRNVLMLSQSRHPARQVWTCLAKFLAHLLKRGILSPDELEQQCVALLRKTWPQPILKSFTTCIQEVLEAYQSSGDYKFHLLMEWLSGFYGDMEFFD